MGIHFYHCFFSHSNFFPLWVTKPTWFLEIYQSNCPITAIRQGICLKKLAICLTSFFIADFYEISCGESAVGLKKLGPEVTRFLWRHQWYRKSCKKGKRKSYVRTKWSKQLYIRMKWTQVISCRKLLANNYRKSHLFRAVIISNIFLNGLMFCNNWFPQKRRP